MATLRDFLPKVLTHVNGCPEPLALQALRTSAIDWCERTRCWRFVATAAITTTASGISIPDYAMVHEIEHATMNGRILEPVIYTDVDRLGLDTGSRAWALTQTEPGQITVLAFETGTLKLSLWLKPKQGNLYSTVDGRVVDALDNVPQLLVDHHTKPIVHGALAELMSMLGQPWSNPQMAAAYAGMVEERAPQAKSKSLRGQQRAPVRSKTLWL